MMKDAILKKCENCGKLFNCHGDNDCWCEQAQIHKREMVVIMNKFKDCICPDCLKQFEKQ